MKKEDEKSNKIVAENSDNTNITDNTEETKERKQRKIIVILAVLLALSAAGLAARYIYLQHLADTPASIEIPDNLVGDKEEASGSGNTGTADFVVPASVSGGADDGQSADTNKNSASGKDSEDEQGNDPGEDNTGGDNPSDNPGDDTGDDPSGDNTGDSDNPNTNPTTTGGSSGRSAILLNLFEGNEYTKDEGIWRRLYG